MLRRIAVSREHSAGRTDNGIEILPVDNFLRLLWRGELDSTAGVRQ